MLRARAAIAALAVRADLLHAHFGNTAAALLPVRRLSGLPLVVSFYGWDASAAPLKDPRLYEELFREAAAVVVLSEEMRATLRRLGCPARKLHVVHVAVRTDELRAAVGRQDRVGHAGAAGQGSELRLLAVGRLVEKKGLDDALAAIALLAGKGIRCRYRIVGEGPLRASLEAQARGLGLNGQVEFAGPLPRDQVFQEMAGCDAFFLPSRQATSGDREGTPTVLIEAGAMGIPCVATRHAGTPEVVLDGETGLLAEERDAAGLAAHLQRLALDAELRTRLGAAARRHIDAEFELVGQCRRLAAVYRRVLEAAA
jgi:glycosyltransferase involved in cell wall biosynthesis